MKRVCLAMVVLLWVWAPVPSPAAPDKVIVTLTAKACAGEGSLLTLSAKVSTFVVEASGLKLSQRPKELLIMRKPVSFYRIPWVAGKNSYDVSPATAKPAFGEDGLFPLRPGEKLTIGVMSPKDEVIVSCDVAIR